MCALLLSGCTQSTPPQADPHDHVRMNSVKKEMLTELKDESKFVSFSKASDGLYKFSALIPLEYKSEYVPSLKSINIYNPVAPGETTIEQSQIFIRHFSANKFLTLSTVDILKQKSTQVHGHDAVMYTIKKKPAVANFAGQPAWRSEEHSLVDIRFTNNNPSDFYVFAYNPTFGADTFEAFIDSIIFHNDKKDIVQPLSRAVERITKKPFGLEVSPDNSPIEPERFSGLHVGVDYEIFEGEEEIDVPVYAVCSGPMREKMDLSGYGGLLVQRCMFEDQEVSVLYGHVDLAGISLARGDYVQSGTQIAVLGKEFSDETDGERKHLHLGVHKVGADGIYGTLVNGYVKKESQLEPWIDFAEYIQN